MLKRCLRAVWILAISALVATTITVIVEVAGVNVVTLAE
jgi:hypothetical protein